MTEREFQSQVIEAAHLFGWRVASFRAVRVQRKDGSTHYETPVGADGKGWPDLFMVKGCRMIAAELKVAKNKATAEQKAWLLALAGAGVEPRVWYPDSWPEIESELRS